MRGFILLILPALVFFGCDPSSSFRYAQYEDLEWIPPDPSAPDPCYLPAHYIPDTAHLDHTPMKYVRVNLHFMNSADGSANFVKPAADSVAWWIVEYANMGLERNQKMKLPLGNDTPVLPVRYRYRTVGRTGEPTDNGVYCHFDDSLFYYIHKGANRNLFSRKVINQYGVQLDSVLNIFLMPYHPDSLPPGTDSPGLVGVALGNAIKLAGITPRYYPLWAFKANMNHEVGHIYGLRHAWLGSDGCEDTPPNPNCWNQTNNGSVCDSLVSNNMMDYNSRQDAITPCQIGIIQSQMARENSRGRRYLERNWCALDPEKTVRIRDTVVWESMKDLEGELMVERGGHLTLRCRLAMPREAHIIVAAGGTLVLDGCRIHNDCGDQWSGILLQVTREDRGRILVANQPVIEQAHFPITFPASTP